jgi:lipopolysaccharide transport system ATP-binding protein
MERLIGDGCTLLVVSHSMGQVLQFCDQAIWLERGEVVMNGTAIDVVKAYDKFSHELRRQSKLSNVEQMPTRRQSDWLADKAARALNVTLGSRKVSGKSSDTVERWSVDDSPLQIDSVLLHRGDGTETTAFSSGDTLAIRVTIKANQTGTLPCCCGIVIYNGQGQLMGRFVSPVANYTLNEGETRSVDLVLDTVMYGSGSYLISTSIHEYLDLRQLATATWYDLHGRSHQFDILEDPVDSAPMFRHPHNWVQIGSPDETPTPKET